MSGTWLLPVTAEEEAVVISSADTASADGAAVIDAITSAVTIIPSFFLI